MPGDTAVDKELDLLRARVETLPKNVDLLVLLGRAWVQKARNTADPGFYLHADACAQEALRMKPAYNPATNLQALALLNGHRFAEARDLANKMLEIDRDDLMALGTLSDALLELGDVDGAAAAAQRMMDIKPSLPSYARASYLLWLRGDEPGALNAIRLAYDAGRLQKDKEPTAWVLTEAANIFRVRGDIEGALAGYDKALGEKPDFAPALVGRAKCLLAQNKSAEAIADLEKALALQPLVETAWLLGDAEAVRGDLEKAKRAWERAKQIGKQTDPRMLAYFLATKNQDLDEAQRAFDDDRKIRGGIYLDDIEALLAWRRGDLERAKAASARALKLGTPDPRLQLHRGLILGDKKLVADALEKGAKSDIILAAIAKELPR